MYVAESEKKIFQKLPGMISEFSFLVFASSPWYLFKQKGKKEQTNQRSVTVIDGKFLVRRIQSMHYRKSCAIFTQTGKFSYQDSLFLLLILII